jgi:hypothetical protein
LALIVLLLYATMLNANLVAYLPTLVVTDGITPLYANGLSAIVRLTTSNPYAAVMLYVGAVFVQALMLNAAVNSYRLFESPNYVVALAYIVLTALFNEYLYWSAPFLAVFPLLFALDRLMNSYDDNTYAEPFDVGLSVGVASLLYLPAAVLFIFAVISLSMLRAFTWRHWLLCISGIGITYFLTGTYYFYTDRLPYFFVSHFSQVSTGVVQIKLQFWQIAAKILLFGLVSMMAIGYFLQEYYRSMVKIRKYMTVITYLLVAGIVMFLFMEQFSLAPIAISVVGIAVLWGYALQHIRNARLVELMHLLAMASVLGLQYAPQFW